MLRDSGTKAKAGTSPEAQIIGDRSKEPGRWEDDDGTNRQVLPLWDNYTGFQLRSPMDKQNCTHPPHEAGAAKINRHNAV